MTGMVFLILTIDCARNEKKVKREKTLKKREALSV